MAKLTLQEQLELWEDLQQIQEAFPYTSEGFLLFAQTIINLLITGNPNLNRVQADICKYLFGGPLYRMIQAQRGQAKTTLTAIYAVFRIIHAPHTRIVIFSQSGKRAKEIAGWVIKIFNNVDFLHFMLPDDSNGDRASIEAFEIHWALRGSDKSPSVACQSIEAGAQGMRADVLIADDVESLQNSRTTNGRELLEDVTKEFESINTHGDIIYLGTPQSVESIYNNLPSRGYDIRIWCGRYPTVEQEANYGSFLAPMLQQDMINDPSLRTGGGANKDQGKPTCPEMFSEGVLQTKETSQGKAKFQLQYMLNTKLSDEGRFPLRLADLIVSSIGATEGPVMPIWATGKQNLIENLPRFGNRNTDKFYSPISKTYEWLKYERSVMYIDTAGGGKNSGDEMAYAVIKLIGSYIYIADVGGFPGGYTEDKLMKLVNAAKDNDCKTVFIEKNYGNGAHASMLKPLFEVHWPVTLEEVYETGQKELRIIDVIEPVLSSHRLIVSPELIQKDWDSTAIYATDKRLMYTLFFQLCHITRAKDCLRHDDRLDALAGAIRQIVQSIDYDMQRQMNSRNEAEAKAWLATMNDKVSRREYVTGVANSSKSERNIFSATQKVGRRKLLI